MYNLKQNLLTAIEQIIIENSNENQIGNLTGSNALLFDGFNFESEKSDHCPRIALLRRNAGIKEPKSVQSWISNNHGRLLEDLLRTILKKDYVNKEKVEFKEEEEAQVTFQNDDGSTLLTARPDKIAYTEEGVFPIEIKTVQSNTTAYYVFIKERPQLGALIQCAIYMMGNDVDEGLVLYCASNWFYGFAGKSMWKVEPGFKQFELEMRGGDLYFDGKKSIVSVEKIFLGAKEYLKAVDTNTLLPKPQWVDASGELAKNSGCTYCYFKDICEECDEKNITELDKFFNLSRDKLKSSY